jgi:hypothetical protein
VQTLVGAACRLLNIHNDLSQTLNLSQFGQFDLLPSAEFEPIRHTLHCSPCLQSSRWRSAPGISIVTAMPDNNYTQVIQWSINYMTFAIMTEFVCPNYIKWNINRKDQKYFQDIYLKVQIKRKKQKLQIVHICIDPHVWKIYVTVSFPIIFSSILKKLYFHQWAPLVEHNPYSDLRHDWIYNGSSSSILISFYAHVKKGTCSQTAKSQTWLNSSAVAVLALNY